MSDNEAKIKIIADASAVAPGVNTAKAGVEGLGATVAASSAQMRASFSSVSASVKEMGISIRETVGAVGEMREAAMAFGEALIAAFAVEKIADWAKEMGEGAEKTKHTAEIFGMTVPQVQGLQAVAAATGMSVETLTKGMGILDRNMVQAASGTGTAAIAFKAIGIDAKGGQTQMQMLLTVADKFKNMDDGPKKVALAIALFGRAGKEMIPLLDMGAAGIEKLDARNQEYSAGALIATEANKGLRDWLNQVNERGVALAESTNESKIAMQGFGNVMTDTFAPVLKDAVDAFNGFIQSVIESYREGGTAKDIFDALAGTMRLIGEVFSASWQIVKTFSQVFADVANSIGGASSSTYGQKVPQHLHIMTDVINMVRSAVIAFKDITIAVTLAIEVAFMQLADLVKTTCRIIIEALQFKWGDIAATWHAGMAAIAADAEKQAGRIKSAWDEARAAIDGKLKLPGGGGAGGIPELKGAGGDFDPDLSKQPKAKKPKKEKEAKSRASDWEQDLEDQKTSFAMQQQAQGTFEQWSLQSDVDYWAALLARHDLSARERMSIEEKYLAAIKGSNAQKLGVIEETAKKELDAADKNHDARLAILADEASKVAAIFGTQSKEYEGIQHQITEETRAAANERRQIEDIAAKSTIKLAQEALAGEEQAAKFRVEMGTESRSQEIAQEQQFLARRYALDVQALAQEEAAAQGDVTKLAEINAQKLALAAQYENQRTALAQQGALQRTAVERQLAGQWGDSLAKMVTLQQGFGQTIRQGYMSLVNAFDQMIAKMITQWIEGGIMQIAVSKTVQQKQVLIDAKKAASGAYNALVGVPIIGPVLAPIAAATAFAAVSAYSAAGGWGDVPYDGAQTTLHAREMVLPADIATPLRANLKSGGTPTGAANNNSASGDTHIHHHYSPTIPANMPFADQLAAHEDNVIGMFNRAVRNGKLK